MPFAHRSIAALLLIIICATLLFVTFIALGSWQIKRLYWKNSLIERVEQRVHAPAIDTPKPEHWQKVSGESDEYRHVRVSGRFLNELSTLVQASTLYGRGFWLMTPLRTANGSSIFINRGFIPYGSTPCPAKPEQVVEVTGLLRVSEPDGLLWRRNNPSLQQWYSRDVLALAASKRLVNVAPFFIDAEAKGNTYEELANSAGKCASPVAGLTVIAFHNNHLVYAVTWYTLALMVIVACFIFWRSQPNTTGAER